MYLLARKFPALLSYFYRRSFLSGNLDQIDTWLGMSLGKRDKIFIEELRYQEFWKRDLGESVRQGNVKPFIEESVLQVSSWGFSISDLNVQKKRQGKGIMVWLKSIYKRPPDELTGFLGPIHIWQVNKYAFSGGQVSIEDHRKLGANLEVDIPFTYLSFFLEDDKELEHIRREYGSGRMLTGEIKQRLIEVLSELVERHQAAKALVTDEVFTCEIISLYMNRTYNTACRIHDYFAFFFKIE